MKKLDYLLPIVLAVEGCALLKSTGKTTEEGSQNAKLESVVKTAAESDSKSRGQQTSLRKDDIQADYTIRFWPKGQLKFIQGEGFAGEFDSVLMRGNRHIKSDSKISLNTEENSRQTSVQQLEDKSTVSASKNKFSRINYFNIKSVIVVILVLAISVFVFIKVKKLL